MNTNIFLTLLLVMLALYEPRNRIFAQEATASVDTLTNPCAATLCRTGTRCVSHTLPCLRSPCPQTATCVPLGPTCVPACAAGQVCKKVPVVCKRAPCPDQPMCIKEAETPKEPTPTCNDIVCNPDFKCELRQVMCIRAPCPPIPECVPITKRAPYLRH